MPKSEENTQELNKLLELMRKEANVEEDDVESDEEDEGRSRSDYESEQKYKSFLQGFLARYDEKSGKKKKNASSKKTDAVFTAEDFEPDEPETSEPEEPETEPEEPVAKDRPDRSKDEIHKSASAHLRELREQRKAGGSGQRPEKVPEPVSVDEDDDDDRAPWEDAPEVRSVPVRASEMEPAKEPAEKAARKPAAEELAKNPPISELVRDKMSEEVRNKASGQPSEEGREETRQPAYARSPESKPEETEPESAGAALEEIPEETLAEETPVSETVTDEITDKIPEEVMDAVQDEVPEESPAEPETTPEAAEDGETPEDVMDAVQDEVSENVSDEGPETAEPEETEETEETEAGTPAAYAFAEAPESVRKEDAHPEDLNPEAMGDEDTRPGIMPNFRRAEPEEPDEAVRTVPRDDLTDTIPDDIPDDVPDDILEPEESGAAETADEANEEEPVLEEEYPEEDEEVEDPEIMWGSRQNRPHTDLVEEKSKGRVGFYGSEPAMSVPLEQTELEMPEAIAPVRPAPEAPHGRRAVRTAAHLRSRVSAPAESSPLRDEDILMLRDLGMRDEALHMIGQRRYDEIIHNDIQFKKEHNLPLDPRIHPDDDSTGGIVKNRIKRKKLNTRSISLVIRAALSLFVTVVLFFTDTVGLSEFAGWFGIETTVTNPLALAIGLQMLLVLYLINFRDFNRGVVGLFAFKPTLWSIPAVSFILTVLYDGLLFFVPDGTDLTFLHIPFSVCLIWTLVAEMFNVAKDVRDFEVVTDGEIKYVLGQLPHRKRVRVDKDGQVSYVRDLDESGVKLGVIRTHRIRDFDGMSTRRPESMNAMRPILYAIPLLSVLVAAAVYLFSGGTPTAYFNSVHLFGLLGLMTMPLPLVIAYSYPHLRAAVRLHRKGAALIGRCVGETVGPTSPRNMTDEDPTTPAEPKDKTYIVFHDDYMFRKMLEVRVRSLHNLDPAEALRRLGAIAKTLGGDLKRFLDIRNIPAREIGSIRVTRYKTNGIEYEYSRAPGLQYFGTGTFLTEHGIQIPDSLARSELDLERDVARLYMGGPDGLDLSLDIVYMPDPAFVKRVRQLDGYGLYTAIQTHDPCLSEGFMYRMWTEQGRLLAKDGRRITMDVYKPFNFEEDYVTIDERCDLAADSEDGLCEAILTDRKLRLDLRRCLFRAWLGAGLGALILLVLWLNNALNLCNGLTVAVYQSVWCLVTMLFDPFQGRSRDEEAKLRASRRTGKADPNRRK